jgi:hypothetical protein
LPGLEIRNVDALGLGDEAVIAVEVSRFCISTLKPRSFEAWSPMAWTTEYDTPMWRSVIFLMSCAQIIGKPVMAPEPTAAPAATDVPFSKARRVTPIFA